VSGVKKLSMSDSSLANNIHFLSLLAVQQIWTCEKAGAEPATRQVPSRKCSMNFYDVFMNSLGPNRARRRSVGRLRHALSSVGTKLHAFGDDEFACSNPWDHCQMGTLPEFQGQTTLHMYGDTVDSIVILLEYCNGSR
jgi:hypothetical protein